MTLSERLRSERLSKRLRPELPKPERPESELLGSERLWSLKAREPQGENALPVFVGFPAPGLNGEVCLS